MRKYLKVFAYTLLVIILLLTLGFIGLVQWFNPNKLKPHIINYIKEKFHREIRFGQDIHWSLFPHIGVNVADITIMNPNNFSEPVFLHIDKAIIGINLVDFIENKKITTTKLDLNGFTLNLIVDENNKNNWSDFLYAKAGTENVTSSATSSDDKLSQPIEPNKNAKEGSHFEFKIPQLSVEHFNLTCSNAIKNQKFTLNDFNLHANNMGMDKSFPLMLSTVVSNSAPQFNTQVKFQSTVYYDSKQQTVQLSNFILAGMLNSLALKSGTSEYSLSGATQVNLRTHKANLKNMLLTFDDLKAIINLAWENDKYQGSLSIPETNLRALLQQLQKNITSGNPEAFKKVSANLSFSGNKDSLAITPISLKLNDSIIQGNANILNFNNPTINFTLSTHNLPLSDYFSELHGTFDASIKAQATGKDTKSLLAQNTGDIQIQWNDPALHLDINPALNILVNVLKKPNANGESTDITFQSLTGTGRLSNGVITTNDLKMIAKNALTLGQGNLDMVQGLINMNLKIQTQNISDDSKLAYFRENPLPVNIKGPLSSPKISFDIDMLLKALLQKQTARIQDKVQKQLEQKVQEKLNDFLGDLVKQ